jgi:hypothetical protein
MPMRAILLVEQSIVSAVQVEPDLTTFLADGFDMQSHKQFATGLVAASQCVEQFFVLLYRTGIFSGFAVLQVEALGKVLHPRGDFEQDWTASSLMNQPVKLDVEFEESLVILWVCGNELLLQIKN